MLNVSCLVMDTCKFIVILLLYCVTAAYCRSLTPLNERSSPELTWQAWLLIAQNQSKPQINEDGMLRRRITPKSVFIAPTFSPTSLPACSEGYASDVMGRCVPIIKIDEDAHYGFLLQRLKEKFGPLDYDYQSEEDIATQGPLQINIPLQINTGDDDEEETDAAIVISPTMPVVMNFDKRDSIDEDEKKQELFLKKLAATTTREPEEISTVTELVTASEETSTLTEDLPLVTEPLTTTEDGIISTESHNTKRSTETTEGDLTTTTEELPETTTTDVPTTTTIQSKKLSTSAPVAQSVSDNPIVVKFPEDLHTQDLKNSFVRFPDTDVSFQTQIPSSVESSQNTRDVSNDEPVLRLGDSSASGHKVVFPGKSQPEETNLDYSNGARHFPPATNYPSYNRRNRDKPSSMFLLPPRWSQPNFQKPLVLRFSRKHAYVDESQFHPDYYRAVPMDDYAYLFGKHKQSSHR